MRDSVSVRVQRDIAIPILSVRLPVEADVETVADVVKLFFAI